MSGVEMSGVEMSGLEMWRVFSLIIHSPVKIILRDSQRLGFLV
jgi:hypothetical protein